MRNKYPGKCIRCGVKVAPGEGHFEKIDTNHLYTYALFKPRGKWATRCLDCVGKGNQPLKEFKHECHP